MTSIQVYGIPTCGTCKKALQWLDGQQIAYEFINTKEQPSTPEQIASWVKVLGFQPMRNTSGQSYRALDDAKDTWSDAEWIAAFSNDMMLLKRPIFVRDGIAIAVGFRNVVEIQERLSQFEGGGLKRSHSNQSSWRLRHAEILATQKSWFSSSYGGRQGLLKGERRHDRSTMLKSVSLKNTRSTDIQYLILVC